MKAKIVFAFFCSFFWLTFSIQNLAGQQEERFCHKIGDYCFNYSPNLLTATYGDMDIAYFKDSAGETILTTWLSEESEDYGTMENAFENAVSEIENLGEVSDRFIDEEGKVYGIDGVVENTHYRMRMVVIKGSNEYVVFDLYCKIEDRKTYQDEFSRMMHSLKI
jgi:CRISPR/Cas system CMR-associated protein Cmr5 small subunit